MSWPVVLLSSRARRPWSANLLRTAAGPRVRAPCQPRAGPQVCSQSPSSCRWRRRGSEHHTGTEPAIPQLNVGFTMPDCLKLAGEQLWARQIYFELFGALT